MNTPLYREDLCQFFPSCGGCALQGLNEHAYSQIKLNEIQSQLAQHQIVERLEPIFLCAPYTRRRVVLAAIRERGKIILGFHRYKSHEVIAIENCAIAVKQITQNFPLLYSLAETILTRPITACRLDVLATAAGLSITILDIKQCDETLRRRLIELALSYDVARLSFNKEIILEQRKPQLLFSGVPVTIPPGAFVQATQESEAYMTALACEGLKGVKSIADLFCGLGTFTFPLSVKACVHAVEQEESALNALEQAYRNYGQNLKAITTQRRDLFERPLKSEDLKKYDGVIFDPPRAGAARQAQELAKSCVSHIVAVSCNAKTFARDLSILVKGGYQITKIFPIDQFLWSTSCEIMAFLHKKTNKKKFSL